MPVPSTVVARGFEVTLVLCGAVLLWRTALSPVARAKKNVAQLQPWDVSPTEFLIFLLHAFTGGFVGSVAASLLAGWLHITGDRFLIFGTTGLHLGILAGLILFHVLGKKSAAPAPVSTRSAIASGAATFLIATPLVFIAGFAWDLLLASCGVAVENQPAVELFARLHSSPWLALMVITAAGLAPVTEESVFRKGIFGYVRTRLPRWAALLLPATLFAAMHADLNTFGQLVVLGVVFSLAYERTGKIATTMVAHALFNLNMMFMVTTKVVP